MAGWNGTPLLSYNAGRGEVVPMTDTDGSELTCVEPGGGRRRIMRIGKELKLIEK